MAKLRIWFVVFFITSGFAAVDTPSQTIPREPEAYRPDQIKVGLHRSGACGTCPDYTLSISGDGTVKYVGTQGLGVVGSREDKISTEQVALLVNAFLRTHFFDLLNEYRVVEVVRFNDGKYGRSGTFIDHGLDVILSLELGQRRKQIIVHYGYPAELKDLADLVDKVTQSDRWTARQ